MRKAWFNCKTMRRLLIVFLVIAVCYISGRLYYRLTGGFTEGNITYALPYDPQWEVAALAPEDKDKLDTIVSQPFYYLGKGCQSYVFSSHDGKYVIKFFKYQRFRPQEWLNYFTFIPFVEQIQREKIAKKKVKLDNAFAGWKLAYEELQPETGVIFVHLNKSGDFQNELVIYDKLGLKHTLQLGNLEFMIQKKADMLCSKLLQLKDDNQIAEAQLIIDRLIAMIVHEYQRGYADNDHALMQNTGVYDSFPIHIDVGQFVKNPLVMQKEVYHQELFNKMWKFRKWLRSNYSELADYLDLKLEQEIGDGFSEMKPHFYKADVARIPHLF